jgi:transposase InsO family protein
MDLVEQLDDPAVSVTLACDALGLSRATLYRHTQLPVLPSGLARPPSPRRLSDEERAAVLAVFHSPEFVDQPVQEVYAALLSRGLHLASRRTMYRLLAAEGETSERRRQRAPYRYTKPSLTATAPNQVWTWDITKLATTRVVVFLHAYVIIDLFSRYVVGWMVAEKECKHLATQLFAETIARQGVEPGITVHSDRGSAMKSDTLAQLLVTLGAQQSFSRPHVSDDNAFSEAQFRTLKYQADYPGKFEDVRQASGWLAPFFGWHNEEHHHTGLALFTPAEVFFGRVEEVACRRQAALDAAYAAHPNRFAKGPPTVKRPPREVSINPLTSKVAEVTDDSPASPVYPTARDGAQDESRAAEPAREASTPLTRSSTGAARPAPPVQPLFPS